MGNLTDSSPESRTGRLRSHPPAVSTVWQAHSPPRRWPARPRPSPARHSAIPQNSREHVGHLQNPDHRANLHEPWEPMPGRPGPRRHRRTRAGIGRSAGLSATRSAHCPDNASERLPGVHRQCQVACRRFRTGDRCRLLGSLGVADPGERIRSRGSTRHLSCGPACWITWRERYRSRRTRCCCTAFATTTTSCARRSSMCSTTSVQRR